MYILYFGSYISLFKFIHLMTNFLKEGQIVAPCLLGYFSQFLSKNCPLARRCHFTESILLSIKLKVDNSNKQLCVSVVKREVQNSCGQISLVAFLTNPVRWEMEFSCLPCPGKGAMSLAFIAGCFLFALPALVNASVCSRPYNITMHNNLSLLFMAFLQSPYFDIAIKEIQCA